MSKPITPNEVEQQQDKSFPPEVFEVFNELITKKWRNGSATVKQCDVVAELTERLETTRSDVFDRKLLDVEDVYRAAGWTVRYERPSWDDSFEAYFVFTRRGGA